MVQYLALLARLQYIKTVLLVVGKFYKNFVVAAFLHDHAVHPVYVCSVIYLIEYLAVYQAYLSAAMREVCGIGSDAYHASAFAWLYVYSVYLDVGTELCNDTHSSAVVNVHVAYKHSFAVVDYDASRVAVAVSAGTEHQYVAFGDIESVVEDSYVAVRLLFGGYGVLRKPIVCTVVFGLAAFHVPFEQV